MIKPTGIKDLKTLDTASSSAEDGSQPATPSSGTSTDTVAGYLYVGINESGEVIVNHPDIQPDKDGAGYIVFSVQQARAFARLLNKKASEADALT